MRPHEARADVAREALVSLSRIIPAITIAASLAISVLLGVHLPVVDANTARLVLAILIAFIGIMIVLAYAGLRGAATVCLLAAGAFLPANALRVTTTVAMSDFILICAGAALLPQLVSLKGRQFQQIQPLITGALVICLGGILGTLASPDPTASLSQLARFFIASVILPLLVAAWGPSATHIRWLLWVWVLGTSTSVFAAAAERDQFWNGRVDGLSTHSNHLAMTCVLAIGPAIALCVSSKGALRIGWGSATVWLAYGAVISGSRAGLLGLAASFLAFVVLTRRYRLGVGAILAILAISLALYYSPYELPSGNAFDRLIGSGEDSRLQDAIQVSNEGRLERLTLSLNSALDHPFTGIGFEKARLAHNFYLQVWSAAGLLGIAGLLIVLKAVLKWPIVSYRQSRSDTDTILLAGMAASFIGFLASGLVQNMLWDRYVWLVPAMLILTAPYAVKTTY